MCMILKGFGFAHDGWHIITLDSPQLSKILKVRDNKKNRFTHGEFTTVCDNNNRILIQDKGYVSNV